MGRKAEEFAAADRWSNIGVHATAPGGIAGAITGPDDLPWWLALLAGVVPADDLRALLHELELLGWGQAVNTLLAINRELPGSHAGPEATATPGGVRPTATVEPVPTAPVVPEVLRTPTAYEIKLRIAAGQEELRAQAAADEAQRKANEDADWEADPLGFTLRASGADYDTRLPLQYGTDIETITGDHGRGIPQDNPIAIKEIYPGAEIWATTNARDPANMIFLDSLGLDRARQVNYDKVYLDALRESFPERYETAMEAAEELGERIPDEAFEEFLKRFGTDYTALEE